MKQAFFEESRTALLLLQQLDAKAELSDAERLFLDGLTVLDLSGTSIEAIPESINQLASLQRLNLSSTNIVALPESIGQIISLKELNLSGSSISLLPESIGQLVSLQRLDLSGTNISSVPNSVCQLHNLQELDISRTQVMSLPLNLSLMASIRTLDLSASRIAQLPESIGQLSNLQELYLLRTHITELPETIGQLYSLQKLDLDGSDVSSLPDSIGQLSSLRILDLSHTRIASVPESVGMIESLMQLVLSYTILEGLPSTIAKLPRLSDIILEGAQLPSLPPELALSEMEFHFTSFNAKDSSAHGIWCNGLRLINQNVSVFRTSKDTIRQYYSSDYGSIVHETNVFFLGEPGTNRSLAIERILNRGGQLKSNKPALPLRQSIHVSDTSDLLRFKGNYLRLRLWDFSDEATLSSLYRCFIKDYSVYVIMVKNGQEINQQSRYWLERLSCFISHSYVILAVESENIRNQSATYMDAPWLTNDFPILYTVLYVSPQASSKKQFLTFIKTINQASIAITKKAIATEDNNYLTHDVLTNSAVSIIRGNRNKSFLTKENAISIFQVCGVPEKDYDKLFGFCNILSNTFPSRVKSRAKQSDELLLLDPAYFSETFLSLRGASNKGIISSSEFEQSIIGKKRKRRNWFLQEFEQYDLAYTLYDGRILFPHLCKGIIPKAEEYFGRKYHQSHQFEIPAVADLAIFRLIVMLTNAGLEVFSCCKNGFLQKGNNTDVTVQILDENMDRRIVQVDSFAYEVNELSLFNQIKTMLREICKDLPVSVEEYVLAGASRFSVRALNSAHENGSKVIAGRDRQYNIAELLMGTLPVQTSIVESAASKEPVKADEKKMSVNEASTATSKIEIEPSELRPKSFRRLLHYCQEYKYLPDTVFSRLGELLETSFLFVKGPYLSQTGSKCMQINGFGGLTAVASINTKRSSNTLYIDMFASGRIPVWELFSCVRDLLLKLSADLNLSITEEYITINGDAFSVQQLLNSYYQNILRISGKSDIYKVKELLGDIYPIE